LFRGVGFHHDGDRQHHCLPILRELEVELTDDPAPAVRHRDGAGAPVVLASQASLASQN